MPAKRAYWALAFAAVFILIAAVGWLLARPAPPPLVSGKPVSYWLDNLPREAGDALLPADHPLAQAGPEVIPSLIHAIEKNYAWREFIDRHRNQFPPFLAKHLPKQSSHGFMIRTVAAFRLGLFGAAASNAVPPLIELLKQPRAYAGDKSRIIQALGHIGSPAKPAVPALADALNDTNQQVRMTAATSLLQIGTVPPQAVPALKRNLADTGYVAALMATAICIAEPSPEALSRIKSMLEGSIQASSGGTTRAHAAAALGFLREVPDELKPVLARLLDDQTPSVRQGAAIGLARPGAENLDRIIAVLVEGLKRGEFQIRCAGALGRIGPAAASAKPELKQATGYVLRIAADNALEKISAK